jgi:hypothetical protein
MVATLSPLSSTGINATRANFRHETLNRGTDIIRLIKILPNRSADSLLQLSLWHDDVSSASYRCLSYRWGEQLHQYIVLVNGKEFFVGENLHSFLRKRTPGRKALPITKTQSCGLTQYVSTKSRWKNLVIGPADGSHLHKRERGLCLAWTSKRINTWMRFVSVVRSLHT